MSVVEAISRAAMDVVDTAGSPGLAAVMAAEAVLPIPSEAVLPAVGAQVSAGQMSFAVAVLCASLGSTLGAWVVYGVGRLGGRERVKQVARLLGLDSVRWARIEDWFERRGAWVVLLSRLVP